MVDLVVIRSKHLSFSSHRDRFPFWALNTKLRAQAQAQAQGRVFMHKHIGADNLTVADISEKRTNQHFSRQCSDIWVRLLVLLHSGINIDSDYYL